jgi:hypothetical protein
MSAASYRGPFVRRDGDGFAVRALVDVAFRRAGGAPLPVRERCLVCLGGTVLFFANEPPVVPAHGGPSAPARGPRNGCFYISDSITGMTALPELRIPR